MNNSHFTAKSGNELAERLSLMDFIAQCFVHNPSSIDQQDDKGMTPLHIAACCMNRFAVALLSRLDVTAAGLHRRDNVRGCTPLELLEFSMRRQSEYWLTQSSLQKDVEPYPERGLSCAYTLRTAMAPMGLVVDLDH